MTNPGMPPADAKLVMFGDGTTCSGHQDTPSTRRLASHSPANSVAGQRYGWRALLRHDLNHMCHDVRKLLKRRSPAARHTEHHDHSTASRHRSSDCLDHIV